MAGGYYKKALKAFCFVTSKQPDKVTSFTFALSDLGLWPKYLSTKIRIRNCKKDKYYKQFLKVQNSSYLKTLI